MPANVNSNEAKYGFPKFDLGPTGMFDGFFRAPTTGNYTFIAIADDHVKLWVSQNSDKGFTTREELIYNSDWGARRDFAREYYGRGRFATPLALLQWGRKVRSKMVELQEVCFAYKCGESKETERG